ncbi:Electron transport complex protein RnfB [plant metagenome]|uniref:Electron transport complex protein RnfB n=1 Tax=plant metagenome TaxID=1297885 RepID=A0A484R780_9ZZZZ
MPAVSLLAERIDALLPQTQCTQCGYAGCRPYAQAIADDLAPINRCPPGGEDGVAALAALLDRPVLPLDPACGEPGPLRLARIEERHCIGCTLCIAACPVDAILGANKRMHTVLDDWCTGCGLCVPVCPVDCIVMDPPTGRPWTDDDATRARARHQRRNTRLSHASAERDARLAAGAPAELSPPSTAEPCTPGAAPAPDARKQAVIADALARARARRTKPA